jgi:hypothetical protein
MPLHLSDLSRPQPGHDRTHPYRGVGVPGLSRYHGLKHPLMAAARTAMPYLPDLREPGVRQMRQPLKRKLSLVSILITGFAGFGSMRRRLGKHKTHQGGQDHRIKNEAPPSSAGGLQRSY